MADHTSGISVEEHLTGILAEVAAMPTVGVRLQDGAGLVLAEDVTATVNVPSFDNSSMDGYAVRREDLLSATVTRPVVLQVTADLAAGTTLESRVQAGTAARIMTGAPIPEGADAVVPIEVTDGGILAVSIRETPAPGAFVRRTGSDVRIGDPVLGSGRALTARHLAAGIAVGRDEVLVHRRPRIGILSTGSELVAAGLPLRRGQIHDSNSHLLAAAVGEAGGIAVRIASVPDDDDILRDTLDANAGQVDAFVLSGGASVGAHDVTKAVLSPVHTMTFSAVRMQPGKPQGFGRWTDGTLVFALPGNPVSSFVSFEVFVRPAIQKMLGHTQVHRGTTEAIVASGWRSPTGRRQYMPVTIERAGGALRVRPATTGGSGSHLVASLAAADALAIIDESIDQVQQGDRVPVMLLES